ncbi:serine/threonine-protein kinase [Streptomyces sp. RFCAC02]|uniref:serine/threonine-protein kinase n=1 Tax=Streptomyces sp. RFCAC02 TaxID=2499143 RepID=UPI001021EE02|nr:serine/threonine-protein kinase [Streptomyces sp. RFCAC02]
MKEPGPDDPAEIGPYRLVARLATGSTGRVCLGRSPDGEHVAVRLVHESRADDAAFRRRFAREVAVAQRVRSPWTVPVLGGDTGARVPWVATGYVPGPTLRDAVAERFGPLPEASAWALCLGLARALAEIHGHDLVHGGLKPSGILLTPEGPKVTGFGIARGAAVTPSGSPRWLAPEQIVGERAGAPADVFALGAVVAYAVTGTGLPAADASAPWQSPDGGTGAGPVDGPLRGELRDLVTRCTAKDPARRPSPAEIAEEAARHGAAALAGGAWLPPALSAGLGRDAAAPPVPDVPGDPPTHPAGASRGQRRSVRGAAAVGALLLAALATWALLPGGGDSASEAAGDAPGKSEADAPDSDDAPWPGPAAETGLTPETGLTDVRGDADGAGGTGATEPDGATETAPPAGSGAPLSELLPPEVREAGTVTVYAPVDAGPFGHLDGSGGFAGLEPELLAAMGERLGVTFALEAADDRETALERLAGGEGPRMAIGGFSDTPDNRSESGTTVVDSFQDGYVLVMRDGEVARDLGGLCGGTVAGWEGDYYRGLVAAESTACGDPVRYWGIDDLPAMLDAVRDGEADAAFVLYTEIVGHFAEHEGSDGGLALSERLMLIGDYGMAVHRGDGELAQALRAALQSLIDDGTYARAMERWGIPDAAVDTARVNGEP